LGVRRSSPFRLLAFVLALLGSFSAPALALTHGLAHDHLADRHSANAHHDVVQDAWAVAFDTPADGEHAHDHATVDVAPGTRDPSRLDLTHAALPASPAPALVQATIVAVRSPALADRALLARPAPAGGPPPTLRAPPLR